MERVCENTVSLTSGMATCNASLFGLTICTQLSAGHLGMKLHRAGSPGGICKLLVDKGEPRCVHCMISGTFGHCECHMNEKLGYRVGLETRRKGNL